MTLSIDDRQLVRALVLASRWCRDPASWPRLVVVFLETGGIELDRRQWVASKLRGRRRDLAHAILSRRVDAGYVFVVDARVRGVELELVDVRGEAR